MNRGNVVESLYVSERLNEKFTDKKKTSTENKKQAISNNRNPKKMSHFMFHKIMCHYSKAVKKTVNFIYKNITTYTFVSILYNYVVLPDKNQLYMLICVYKCKLQYT